VRAPRIAVVLFALACGCGAARTPRGDSLEDADLADRIRGLPAPARPLGATSERFQGVWTDAELALEARLPPPAIADEAAYSGWLEARLTPWLRERARAIERTRGALRLLRAGPIEERIMGAALLGFVLEDTAREVLEAPVPELAERPARAAELRAALSTEMTPLYAKAREAYARCLVAARGAPPHLAAWRALCEARDAALASDEGARRGAADALGSADEPPTSR
jgi:hypothetical protein